MIYLKTYFYVELEIKYLIMNLIESYDYIDKFIIVEHNTYHNGRKREYIFNNYIDLFPKDKIDKILYIKSDIGNRVIKTDDEETIHQVNEPLMRGNFVDYMKFEDHDIIISVDADEIIYAHKYPQLINLINEYDYIGFNIHFFFFKFNLIMEEDWVACIGAKYKYYINKFRLYPQQWRYGGNYILKEKCGCHFALCMNVDELIFKLNTFSHPKFKYLANRDTIERCVNEEVNLYEQNKKLKRLNKEDCIKIHPQSINYIINKKLIDFNYDS